MLKELLSSKKFTVAIGAVVTAFLAKLAGKYNIAIDPEFADQLVKIICGIAGTYILGQGIADINKNRAASVDKPADPA